jgi:hypothetical protein
VCWRDLRAAYIGRFAFAGNCSTIFLQFRNIRTQITIKSNGPSGLRTRMDAVGQEGSKVKLSEFKASEKAPLTHNQEVVHKV